MVARSPSSPPSPRAELAARVGPQACVLDHADRLTLRLDAEGRWAALRVGSERYRRTVDARVVQPHGHGWRACDDDEAARVHQRAMAAAEEFGRLWRDLPMERRNLIGDEATLLSRLAAAGTWTAARFAELRRRFSAVYPAGISIVPPHRYRDLVVQPAIGCPHNRCTFCDLYADRRFEVLAPDRFAAHLRGVVELMGAAAVERTGIFFDSGTALTLPVDALLERLQLCEDIVGKRKRGVAAFYDPDRGRQRTAADWRQLVQAGLADATLGLETGHGPLRGQVDKSADLSRFIDVARTMKAGGFRLAITVLVGLGGAESAAVHQRDTVARLAEVELGRTDLVYLSRLQGAMADDALEAQARSLRSALGEATSARVGSYRIERFDHFA